MKKNTLNIIIFTVTSVLLIFVTLITLWIDEDLARQSAEPETVVKSSSKLNYSPDGKYLVMIEDKKILVFAVISGKKIKEIKINGEPTVAFSPDSKSLAFTDNDKKIKIISFSENNFVNTIEGK